MARLDATAKGRASQYILVDKKAKMLVGRPALGVAGNELRIPENTGVVGQVVSLVCHVVSMLILRKINKRLIAASIRN